MISSEKLQFFRTYKGWWALVGVLTLYLLFLLVKFWTSEAFDLNDLLTWGAALLALPFITARFENDTQGVIKIGTLGLLAVIVSLQLYILNAVYQPGAGNGFKMAGFFGLVLAAIVVLCHFDMQKRGWKRLNYTVVSVGFLFFGGLLALTVFYAMR